jgi:predicted Zn-dependent protease with MMP-like domain
MWHVTDDEFQALINEALQSLPGQHAPNIKNIAILYDEDPTLQQRQELKLRNDQTLFGLYEGVPLPKRQGMQSQLPDRITLFKGPLERSVNTLAALKEQIRHTLWHEIAHYYGLDHTNISHLE